MNFDFMYYPYPSKRHVVFGTRGIVAASQPLAAQAGLEILKKGGNAIDAVVAAAACLPVVEPSSNGLGGDGFALIWSKGKLYGLNSSGYAPALLDGDNLRSKGHTEMPMLGWIPVTVPGVTAGWAALSERFGKLDFADLLAPAIEFAENGYAVSPLIAKNWQNSFKLYSSKTFGKGLEFQPWFDTFAPKGETPLAGEIVKLPYHANTLKELAKTRCESFYRGEIADKIDAFSKKTGGLIRKEDLANFKPRWVEPISTNYRGYDVWEIPPNGDGIIALIALNILEGFHFKGRFDADTVHKQIESLKLAFEDGKRYVADAKFMDVTVSELLSKEYAEKRRALIGDNAIVPTAGNPTGGGTVYLCAADKEGNMISYIQSNFEGFGSGVVVPETGIALQNRGWGFSLDPKSPNYAQPKKYPFHTIIPGFLTKNGDAVGPFGVMGGFMQPQGHLQVIANTIDFMMNPQAALDTPRWQWTGGKTVLVEASFPSQTAEKLKRMGHDIIIESEPYSFGRGQIIWKMENGAYVGGTEPRTDGSVLAW